MSGTLRCEHTATAPDGERIFAVIAESDEYGLTTGGMRESELRAVVETFEDVPSMASAVRMIRDALGEPQ